MGRSRLALLTALVLATAVLAACGGSAGAPRAGGDDETTALGAVGSVRDTSVTRAGLEWSDLARVRALGGITRQLVAGPTDPDHRRWVRLFGTGAAQIAPAARPLAGAVDLFTAREALQVGRPPRSATRLDGLDTGAARNGLTRLGGKPATVAGHHGVQFAADYQISLNSRLTELGIANALNKVAFDGDRVAFGPAEAPVGDVLDARGGGLAADRAYHDAASCLGKVITADLVPGSEAAAPAGVQVVGLGVLDPVRAGDPAHEVLCLATTDRAAGDGVERLVRAHATPAQLSLRTDRPWSSVMSSITVSRVSDRVVKVAVTDRPETAAGLLVEMLNTRDLAGFIGGTVRPRAFR